MSRLSRVMGKPTFCICENESVDQLRDNREAYQRLCFRYTDTVNQLIFAPINFRDFVFKGIFAAIYFRGLHNWAMQEQCKRCLYGHFRGDLFSLIRYSRE